MGERYLLLSSAEEVQDIVDDIQVEDFMARIVVLHLALRDLPVFNHPAYIA